MASVTQCDVCSNVVKNEQAFFITLRTCNKYGETEDEILAKDICPDCKRKFLKAFGIEEDKKC